MNKIVIELCAEDRARLDKILEALTNAAPRCDNCLRLVAELGREAKAEPGPVPEEIPDPVLADESPFPEEPPVYTQPATEPAPVISLPEFQKAVVVRCAESPETKKKVQALISNYADCVSNVPEGRRAEFLAELAKL